MRVLTDWFPGIIKPVYTGPYLVRYPSRPAPNYGFICAFRLGHFRTASDDFLSFENEIEWRGLAFDPEAARYGIMRPDDGLAYEAWVVEVPR